MTVNIGENVKAYLGAHAPDARYASFDYCFNYFQEAREAGNAACLAGDEHLQLSCLQLGFYLASWGMMRESSGLLQRSVRRLRLLPVVEQIAKEEGRIWELDVDDYAEQADEVLGLTKRVREAFLIEDGFRASDTLVTKTLLGVFGCVPAFYRYFRIGFRKGTRTKPTLKAIGEFYKDNQDEIDAAQARTFTLDFGTGLPTVRRYSRAKIIDMAFFQQGYNPS